MIIPFISGSIIDLNWRMIMFITSVVAFLNMICIIQFPNLKKQKLTTKFDIWGMVLLFFGVGAMDIAFTMLSGEHFLIFGVLLFVSLVLLIIFYFVEKRHKDPIMPIKIMKTPIIEYSIAYTLLMYVSKAIEYLHPQIFTFYGRNASTLGLL
jgi:hypothetical protein